MNVEDDDSWVQGSSLYKGIFASYGFPDDTEICIGLQQLSQEPPQWGMVIHEENIDHSEAFSVGARIGG
jgi:hypothetical protein